MDLLDNPIQPYAWGSRTALAELTGRPSPSPGPEAELWMGAHPAAPSRLVRDGRPTLAEAIADAPGQLLGARTVARFGPRLPFLLKVLAAQAPLSLQAHPSLAQAREGFARETAAGIPPDAPHRNYKDQNHKPEVLCALSPFEALCGFREVPRTVRLLESLRVPALGSMVSALRAGATGLEPAFRGLMTLPHEPRRALVEAVVEACQGAGQGDEFAAEKQWAVRLGGLYPADAGVVGALLLNFVRLVPGEALYLPAGNLHAYLQGTGVELMASSDNVLRGGCTPKHVDAAELCAVLDFRAIAAQPLRPVPVSEVEAVYPTPAPDFRLSRVGLGGGASFQAAGGDPELLLCVAGEVRASAGGAQALSLRPGQAAFVSAADGPWRLEGEGEVFRAAVGSAQVG